MDIGYFSVLNINKMIKNLKDIFTKFSTEDACRMFLVQQRWGGVPECPHCGCRKSYKIEGGKRFKCANKECYKKYSVTVGTVFEASNIPLTTWFQAMYHIVNNKKGMSSVQLAKHLGVTQKTSWFMIHRIRESLREKGSALLVDIVQADETFVGGKNKNRHADKKVPNSQGRSFKDKTPVLGLMHQSGHITTVVIPNTQGETIQPIIDAKVKEGTIIVTDEWSGYNGVPVNYNHVIIDHKSGEYARGAFHTNSIEGFWSIFKRGYIGIYHYMSRKHLQRYCDEFAYRYNSRKTTDGQRFLLTSGQLTGRLTYKMLVHGESSKKEARKTVQG